MGSTSEILPPPNTPDDFESLCLDLWREIWRDKSAQEAGAREDLAEAWEIAERGSIRLHLTDVALYRARFFEDRTALAEARRLAIECGYLRRLPEIEDLDTRLLEGQRC